MGRVNDIEFGRAFRPINHPLLNEIKTCPACGAGETMVSLPGYPADYCDSEACGHSWPTTQAQRDKMWQALEGGGPT